MRTIGFRDDRTPTISIVNEFLNKIGLLYSPTNSNKIAAPTGTRACTKKPKRSSLSQAGNAGNAAGSAVHTPKQSELSTHGTAGTAAPRSRSKSVSTAW
jgi:hypothetical protein